MTRTVVLPIEDYRASRAAASAPPSLSFASEYPVEREGWLGDRWVEVLDLGREAVDLSRAQDGLPLLLGHDHAQIVGRVDHVWLDAATKQLRGSFPRFSRSDAGQAVRLDFEDDIRTEVSIGYRILEVQETGKDARGVPVYRVTRWQPYEVSLAAVPADPTVGKGRSADGAAAPVVVNSLEPEPREGKEREMSDVQDSATRGVAESPTMADAVSVAKAVGVPAERLADWLGHGKDPAGIMQEAVRFSQERLAAPVVPDVPLTEREQRTYSLAAALQQLTSGPNAKREGLAFEVSDELERKFGNRQHEHGLLIPQTLRVQRTLANVGTASKGGVLEFDEYGGFVDFLRNRTTVLQMGARFLPGLQGDFALVEQSAGVTLNWVTETGNSTASSADFAIKRMQPKTAVALAPWTRQLQAQSVESIEQLVRDDVFGAFAVGIDRAALVGGGANEPTGVHAAGGTGSVTIGAQGGAATFATYVQLQRACAAANVPFGAAGYITTPGVAASAMTTAKFSNTGNPIWEGSIIDGLVGGFRAAATNQVPSNNTKGTTNNLHSILFSADWSQLLIGSWGALEVFIDDYTAAPLVRRIHAVQMIDVMLRRAAAFAACKEVAAI